MRDSGTVASILAYWDEDGPHLAGKWPEFTPIEHGAYPDKRPGESGIWRDGFRVKVKLGVDEAVYVRTGEPYGAIAEVYELERLEL